MQYNAATIGIGIDAKIAPNFPKNIIRNRMNNEKKINNQLSTLYEMIRFHIYRQLYFLQQILGVEGTVGLIRAR